jgi:hypothetical protein
MDLIPPAASRKWLTDRMSRDPFHTQQSTNYELQITVQSHYSTSPSGPVLNGSGESITSQTSQGGRHFGLDEPEKEKLRDLAKRLSLLTGTRIL